MAATLKQIATHAGVDISVVSRVLNNKASIIGISQKCQRRVLEIANNLGYVPNNYAQSMRTGKFGCVALLLSNYRNRSYLPNGMLNGINDCLEKHGMHLLISNVPDNMPEKVAELPKILRSLLADGMVVNYNQHLCAEMVSFIERSNLPTVWVNIKREFNCVYPNNFGASDSATQRLIAMGHKRICYVDYLMDEEKATKPDHFSIQDRALGYLESMKKAGLEPIIYSSADFNDFAKLMSKRDRPTALLVYWCGLLTYIMQTIRNLNLLVPRDVSVMTFASQSSAFLGLCTNSVVEPDHEMGEMATEMLLKRIKTPNDYPPVAIDFTFSDAGTCVAPQ